MSSSRNFRLYVTSPGLSDRQQPSGGCETFLVQQKAGRTGWHLHSALGIHREWDDVRVGPEPPRAGLHIGGVDEPRQGRGRNSGLGSYAGFGHGTGPQLGAVGDGEGIDPADLGKATHPMHLDVPDPGSASSMI